MNSVDKPARRIGYGRFAAWIVLVGMTTLTVYPLVWIFLNSLKENQELFVNPWTIPWPPQFGNYVEAWTVGRIGQYLANSAIVVSAAVALTVIIAAMAAYGIERLRWRGNRLALFMFTAGITVPIHAALIPLFVQFNSLGLTNTRHGLVLLYTVFGLPIAIFVLTGFFSAIPSELEEAAIVDGAGIGRILRSVILPISTPAISTVAIFSFISNWNELLFAVVFLSSPAKMTVTVGLTNFSGQYSTNWTAMLAAITLATVPGVVAYVFLNERIVAGVTAGALKG